MIPIAVLAAAGVSFLLLFLLDDTGRERPTRPPVGEGGGNGNGADGAPGGTFGNGGGNGDPSRPPEIEDLVRRRAHDKKLQAELDRFVARCAELGAAAVPELLQSMKRVLEKGDVQLQPRWRFGKDGPIGYPTLRSVYLAALTAIEGPDASDALRTVLEETGSAGEALQASSALAARDETGWTDVLLDHAQADATPATLDLQRRMVVLAASEDPGGTAVRVAREAPRGESTKDPRILAHALRTLPGPQAEGTGRTLLADSEVTPLAKSRYARALLEREDPGALIMLREASHSDGWSDAMRIEVANAAANSSAFFADANACQQATARGDSAAADAARARFERRLRETRDLIETTLGINLDAIDDPRAEIFRRKLNAQRKFIGRR